MVSVAVIVPVRGGRPSLGADEAICEGLDLAGDAPRVRVVLVGSGTREAAELLRAAGFADLRMQCAETPDFLPGTWAAALAAAVDGDESVILPASADGRDLGPRLAACLGRQLVAGAVSVAADTALVARAGGRALAEVACSGPVVATLQPGVRSSARIAAAPDVELEDLDGFDLAESPPDAEVLAVEQAGASTMDLAEAPFIIGIGAGLGSVDCAQTLQEVAASLGASVGATRVVTDDGWIGHDRQIGTTGVVVDPRVYVAFGISGAVQHTAGLGAPDHVISVNTDGHCPMMSRADVAIIADAPEVVTVLRRLLGEPTEGSGEPS